jgi:hypothetical protein
MRRGISERPPPPCSHPSRPRRPSVSLTSLSPVARARVSSNPRCRGDDGSLPSISVLIGRTASAGTDSVAWGRWQPGPAGRFKALPSRLAPCWIWAGSALPRPGSGRSGLRRIFLENALVFYFFCKFWNSIEFVLSMQMKWFKFRWVA